MALNIFARASKIKLRVQTNRGLLGVEDLWNLPLAELDRIAVELNKQIKETPEVSFINKGTPKVDSVTKLAFDIVKSIIDTKMEEKAKRDNLTAIRAKEQKLLELIDKKQDESNNAKSLEDLTAELEELYKNSEDVDTDTD